MKNFNPYYSLFGVIMILLIACDPVVIFQDPMPPEIESINKIPLAFQGLYKCENDSSLFYSFEHVIFNQSYNYFITTTDRVEQTEECSILGGGLYLPGRQECIPFEYLNGDTIMAKVFTIDTLFSFTKNEVAKEYKGRLFLNYKNHDANWATIMISPIENGELKWELIDLPDDLNEVQDLAINYQTRKNALDETQYVLEPSLIEFEKLINKSYGSYCDILTPMTIYFKTKQ